ncbi:SPFH domain / Band 7 family protein [Lacunisphaera limnophila]|uniref:SPFH domain / Band 7 family protein n=1 Tax=Lacunisphaera limnophila TaxID=1838286 RepID=A0A1D8AYK6_9BACT|nr:prohibitin family protein [Lacunisphaera limnophila]AOS45968.1 SPFH domain / Band 7 family protein [Lacunisphaera limnophila]
MNPKSIAGLIAGALVIFVLILAGSSATYVVEPGHRGVEVTLGRVSPAFKPEGFGFKLPFVTHIYPQAIRQQTATMVADCYSSDLQQVKIDVRVLYRVPESSVVAVFRDYWGSPFETLVKPRVAEALNEMTASRSAELIVQKREEVKSLALESARKKLGDVLVIEDIVLEDINLTRALENAIEAKMVQEQEAARARFAQQQAQTEASTVVIKATGEAESIVLRGKALRENPSVLELQIIEHWDGVTPLVVGPGATGANMMLPLGDFTTDNAPAATQEDKL